MHHLPGHPQAKGRVSSSPLVLQSITSASLLLVARRSHGLFAARAPTDYLRFFFLSRACGRLRIDDQTDTSSPRRRRRSFHAHLLTIFFLSPAHVCVGTFWRRARGELISWRLVAMTTTGYYYL